VHPERVSQPFTDSEIVASYEAWYHTTGRRADRLEKTLLRRLLTGFPGASTILEVGCGTGHFTRWFSELGLQAVGLDLSRLMLVEAVRLGSPPCVRGDGLALPFPTGAFDLVAMITTLEFTPNPAHVLAEALRVARRGLILGVLNRQSVLGRKLRRAGGPMWGAARFFTPAELVHLVRGAADERQMKVLWRTTLWPLWPKPLPLPWGGFIGVAVMFS
jgi:ubiquinone/menaquinone biosynthesis C-methylase UbiE